MRIVSDVVNVSNFFFAQIDIPRMVNVVDSFNILKGSNGVFSAANCLFRRRWIKTIVFLESILLRELCVSFFRPIRHKKSLCKCDLRVNQFCVTVHYRRVEKYYKNTYSGLGFMRNLHMHHAVIQNTLQSPRSFVLWKSSS